MATVSELTSYRGDPGLGLGSNADIPVSSGKPLDFVNTVIRDIAARDAQKNILKFQQQVKDRDNLMEALSTGKVKVGDLLKDDMPFVKELGDKQLVAFKNWMQKGYGDADAAVEYKRATQELQDAVTQAEARKVFYDTNMTAAAKEGIPKFADARKAHTEKVIKSGFYNDLIPFQETQRLNVGDILKLAVPRSEQVTDPNRPFYKGTRKFFSWEDAKKNASIYSATPEGLYNIQEFVSTISELPPVELIDKIKLTNQNLARYNQERGLKPGDRDYVEEIMAVEVPGRGLQIKEPMDQLAAKFSLAAQQKFMDEQWEFDKALSDRDVDLKRIAATRAGQQLDYAAQMARVGLDREKFNYAKKEDKLGAASVLNEAISIINKGVETKVELGGGKSETVLRIGDPTLLKSFGTIDKDGNVTNVPDVIDYDKNKNQVRLVYYERDPVINTKKGDASLGEDVTNTKTGGGIKRTASGKNIVEKTITLDQRTWLKEIAKRSFPNKDIGTVNTLIDEVLNENGNDLFKISIGGSQAAQTPAPAPGSTKVTDPELLKKLNGN